ncbi:MAG: nicotinamide-nucleotide amidohydrolase family protein [Pseudomonadota bacterium]
MTVTPEALQALAAGILEACAAKSVMIGTVESCTGGLVAGTLTEIAGSSHAMTGGLVTYSNEAKQKLAHVPEEMLNEHGAVSQAVASAMAEGGREPLSADICVSITGIAGPGGGSAQKPVGLVHFACAAQGLETAHREERFGDLGRRQVRLESVKVALEMLAVAADQIPDQAARP